ncbi:MAG TPA: peptidoglycan-binding domain-containing protein [Polyangia bacterium]|nr:peptidoglycan-binding domain-containing protein [Polyangia bacterium]
MRLFGCSPPLRRLIARVGRMALALLLGAAALAGSTVGGCGHTHAVGATAGGTSDRAGGDHATPPHDRQASAEHRPAAAAPAAANHQSPPKDETPLGMSPAALLKPGAVADVQRQLVQAGALPAEHTGGELDATTQQALARYQREHNLPATGALDNTTVKKLGLNPENIFKSSHD